jgi:hypothetical protein
MTRALSLCIEPGCHELTAGSRCARHDRTSTRNHRGVPRQERGHGADYERRRAALVGLPCHWCGAPATTADYVKPWSKGGTLEDLVPACGPCNYARGAAITNEGAPREISPEGPPPQDRVRPDCDPRQVRNSLSEPRRWFA